MTPLPPPASEVAPAVQAARPGGPRTVAFVLASYHPESTDERDRATGAMAAALRAAGHRAFIITGRRGPAGRYVARLTTLPVDFPCDDATLRSGVAAVSDWLHREINALVTEHGADLVVHVDPLWGLGQIMPDQRVRRVLALPGIGPDEDLRTALANHPDAVITPSPAVAAAAVGRGYDSSRWRVLPHLLLACPEGRPCPAESARERLRQRGPIRAIGRLDAVYDLVRMLHAAGGVHRQVDLLPTLPGAPAHTERREQHLDREPEPEWQATLAGCERLAATLPLVRLQEPLGPRQLPGWLADAATVILLSPVQAFGLTAVEAMCAGTPVVGYAVGDLPELVGGAGVLVPREYGPESLWRAAAELVDDPARYAQRSRTASTRGLEFRPAPRVDLFLQAVG